MLIGVGIGVIAIRVAEIHPGGVACGLHLLIHVFETQVQDILRHPAHRPLGTGQIVVVGHLIQLFTRQETAV